jgi:hypothetical protein
VRVASYHNDNGDPKKILFLTKSTPSSVSSSLA